MVRWLRQEATPGARRSGATALCIAMAVVVGTAGCDALSLPHPFAKTPQVSPIKVGLLHSQTGTMAMSETPLRDAEQLALLEIEAKGGIDGHPVEAVIEDGRSRADVFPRRAHQLFEKDGVVALFGGWTSDSRKAMEPVIAAAKGLLFYPGQYEGNECSPDIVYTGPTPNQQILPALDWFLSPAGGSKRRIYLLGSDYVYPRTANFIARKYLAAKGVEVVGENYVPLGHKDFRPVVETLHAASPDLVLSTINGDSNIDFYKELARQGVRAAEIPVVATSVGENELRALLPSTVEGHYAAASYFQSIDTPANHEFVDKFQQEFGLDRVTDDPMEAAYVQVKLWEIGVRKAGTAAPAAVLAALAAGTEFDGPGGRTKVDPKTHHLFKTFRLGRIGSDRQFDVVFESPEWIAPDPYPAFAFPGWRCDWTQGAPVAGPAVDMGASARAVAH